MPSVPFLQLVAAHTAARPRAALAPLLLALLLLLFCARGSGGQSVNVTQSRDWRSTASELFSRGSSTHSSNWAIIASTSIFWYNYRHTANALAVYRAVKEMGLDDDHIILMLADDHACNARNVFQGQVFSETGHTDDLYGSDVSVDYRGRDATEQNLLRLLIGRHVDGTHRSKMLLSDGGSNVLLYMSGHGGDGFLKFRDVSNVQSRDLADALETMRTQRRFREMLVFVDTCQAATMPEPFVTPRVTSISSSLRGENSYASAHDEVLGQALLDRFTHATLQFIKLNGHTGTVSQLVASLAPVLRSDHNNPQTLDVRATQGATPMRTVS